MIDADDRLSCACKFRVCFEISNQVFCASIHDEYRVEVFQYEFLNEFITSGKELEIIGQWICACGRYFLTNLFKIYSET